VFDYVKDCFYRQRKGGGKRKREREREKEREREIVIIRRPSSNTAALLIRIAYEQTYVV
jgi:hypothetical protein